MNDSADVKALVRRAQAMLLDSEVGSRSERDVVMAKLVTALEASQQAPVVEREALARHFYMRNSGRPGEDFDYLMGRYRKGLDGFPHISFGEADALIASGILQDADELRAKTLEEAADDWNREHSGTRPGPYQWFWARAQAIREGRA